VKNAAGVHQNTPQTADAAPKHTITSLNELPDLLEKL